MMVAFDTTAFTLLAATATFLDISQFVYYLYHAELYTFYNICTIPIACTYSYFMMCICLYVFISMAWRGTAVAVTAVLR